MTLSAKTRRELTGLVGGLLDGGLDESQSRRLSQTLQSDPAARDYYAALFQIHAELCWRHGESTRHVPQSSGQTLLPQSSRHTPCAETEAEKRSVVSGPLSVAKAVSGQRTAVSGQPEEAGDLRLEEEKSEIINQKLEIPPFAPSPSPLSPSPIPQSAIRIPQSLRSRPMAFSLFVSTVATVSFLLLAAQIPIGGSGIGNLSTPPLSFVAQLTGGKDCQWGDDGELVFFGSHLRAGQFLDIRKGLAEISYYDGATVLIEGPAKFVLEGTGQGRLERGKLVAKVKAKTATGFTIHTPTATVVDLGTEFGVEATNGDTFVRVFAGVVDVQANSDDAGSPLSSRRLNRDDAVRVSAGKVNLSAADATAFVRNVPSPLRRFRLTELYREVVLRSRPIAYWRFDELVDGRVASEIDPRYPLEIYGNVKIEQSETGGKSAKFLGGKDMANAKSAHLSLAKPLEELRGSNYSIEFWIWPDQIAKADQAVVSLCGDQAFNGRPQGTMFLFELPGSESKWFLPATLRVVHRYMPAHYGGEDMAIAGAYVGGAWYHLTAIKDERELALYVNGMKKVAQPSGRSFDRAPLGFVLGDLIPDDQVRRPFAGLLDEVAIFSRALSANEVRMHYSAAFAPDSSSNGKEEQ